MGINLIESLPWKDNQNFFLKVSNDIFDQN